MTVVSMGWTWGLYFCQSVVEEGVRRGLGLWVPAADPSLWLLGARWPSCVDGAAIVGLNFEDTKKGFDVVVGAPRAQWLRLHGLREPAGGMDEVDVRFFGGAQPACRKAGPAMEALQGDVLPPPDGRGVASRAVEVARTCSASLDVAAARAEHVRAGLHVHP